MTKPPLLVGGTVIGVAALVFGCTKLTGLASGPGFSLATDPMSVDVALGQEADVALAVARRGGFAGPIQVEVDNLPAGVTSGKVTILGDAGTGAIFVAASASAPLGTTSLVVRGTSGAEVEAASLELHVVASLADAGADATDADNGTPDAGPDHVVPDTDPARTAVALTVGGSHACALLANGGVACWGANAQGQLGGGTTGDSYTSAVKVGGLPGVASGVAAGFDHACAALAAGGAACWGSNTYGQLGIGAQDDKTHASATVLGHLTQGLAGIAAGHYASFGILPSGQVLAWGNPPLGAGNVYIDLVPAPISTVTGVKAMATGPIDNCVIDGQGAACWGLNLDGELGDPNTTGSSKVPVRVQGLAATPTSLALSESTACGTVFGKLLCWGLGFSGPTPIENLDANVIVAAQGPGFTCGLRSSGEVLCFGNNAQGSLGLGTTDTNLHPTATAVPGVTGATGLAAGGTMACAIVARGGVLCWGLPAPAQPTPIFGLGP
jgi:hypothetical protein